MSRAGWDATGLLRPLWEQLPGKRDELARLSGVRGNELSSHNTGKRLGLAVAQRIIDGFAKANVTVTLAELGAPPELTKGDPASMSLHDRLEELRKSAAVALATLDEMKTQIGNLEDRIRTLEDEREAGAA